MIGDVTFKDSYAFTKSSLDKLVDNLEIYQLVNTRKWLEMNIKQCYENNDDNSSDNDEKMDWETDYDISFIDNRSPDQHLAKSNSRYHFATTDDDDDNDNDDDDDNEFSRKHNFDSNDDNEDFIQSERCCMAIKDDDDEDDVDDVHNDIINNNSENFNVDDTFTYGDDYDDDMLFQMDGEDVNIYTKEMSEFDYRRNVYTQSTLTEEEQHLVDGDLILLKRKGVYPYEYMDSFEKCNECKIPDINSFKGSISGETISNKDYEYAKTIFQHFDMKTLQDYHNLYLLQDVLLLDDVLTAFREVCIKSYDLDPWHYYTVPGLTWDAGLKYTRVTLGLLTEEDKFLFVEGGMRGGIILYIDMPKLIIPISKISVTIIKRSLYVNYYI